MSEDTDNSRENVELLLLEWIAQCSSYIRLTEVANSALEELKLRNRKITPDNVLGKRYAFLGLYHSIVFESSNSGFEGVLAFFNQIHSTLRDEKRDYDEKQYNEMKNIIKIQACLYYLDDKHPIHDYINTVNLLFNDEDNEENTNESNAIKEDLLTAITKSQNFSKTNKTRLLHLYDKENAKKKLLIYVQSLETSQFGKPFLLNLANDISEHKYIIDDTNNLQLSVTIQDKNISVPEVCSYDTHSTETETKDVDMKASDELNTKEMVQEMDTVNNKEIDKETDKEMNTINEKEIEATQVLHQDSPIIQQAEDSLKQAATLMGITKNDYITIRKQAQEEAQEDRLSEVSLLNSATQKLTQSISTVEDPVQKVLKNTKIPPFSSILSDIVEKDTEMSADTNETTLNTSEVHKEKSVNEHDEEEKEILLHNDTMIPDTQYIPTLKQTEDDDNKNEEKVEEKEVENEEEEDDSTISTVSSPDSLWSPMSTNDDNDDNDEDEDEDINNIQKNTNKRKTLLKSKLSTPIHVYKNKTITHDKTMNMSSRSHSIETRNQHKHTNSIHRKRNILSSSSDSCSSNSHNQKNQNQNSRNVRNTYEEEDSISDSYENEYPSTQYIPVQSSHKIRSQSSHITKQIPSSKEQYYYNNSQKNPMSRSTSNHSRSRSIRSHHHHHHQYPTKSNYSRDSSRNQSIRSSSHHHHHHHSIPSSSSSSKDIYRNRTILSNRTRNPNDYETYKQRENEMKQDLSIVQSHYKKLLDKHDSAEEVSWSSEEETHKVLPTIYKKVHKELPRIESDQNRSSTNGRYINKWTDIEIGYLLEGIKEYGKGHWAEILKEFPFNNRTSVNLKDKYRNLVNAKKI